MILVSAARMSAAGIERTATAIATGAAYSLALRRIFWRGKNHLPKCKTGDAGEHEQQHSEMHPTRRVHWGLPPRPGCQFDSTERM